MTRRNDVSVIGEIDRKKGNGEDILCGDASAVTVLKILFSSTTLEEFAEQQIGLLTDSVQSRSIEIGEDY